MSHIFAAKTNNAFYQTVLPVIVALAAMFLISLKAYQLSSLYFVILMHKTKDACGCSDMAQFFSMHPDIFRAVIIFGIGIGIFIFYSLYKLAKLISRTKKYIAHYLSFAKAEHSVKLKTAIKALDLDGAKIIEINKSDLIVFCFGFFHPKICISGALIDMLDKNELKAVLLHEAQHMISYEPLKVLIVKYFRSIFFFLPGLKNSAEKYITLSELSADEKAGGDSTARSSLASAILKIFEQEENRRSERGSSLSFFSQGIEERASRLSDAAYIPKFNFFDKSVIFGSIALISVSLVVILIFSDSTKAFEMHSDSGCILPDNSKNDLFCSLAGEKKNSNSDGNIFNNMNSADFHQKSSCKIN